MLGRKQRMTDRLKGDGGKVAAPAPPTDEEMDHHQQSRDQAQAMLHQAQQFMQGGKEKRENGK
jgi:hypothetical protein